MDIHDKGNVESPYQILQTKDYLTFLDFGQSKAEYKDYVKIK